MKPILTLLAVLLAGHLLAQEVVFVNEISCSDAACTTCTACNDGACINNGTDCMPICSATTSCATCAFASINTPNITFGSMSMRLSSGTGIVYKKKIKVFAINQIGGSAANIMQLAGADQALWAYFKLTKASNPAQFLPNVGNSVPYASGDEFWVEFTPGAITTNLDINNGLSLQAKSNNGCTAEVFISGHAMPPPARSFVLAMDKSGSMSEFAVGTSGKTKLQWLQSAAKSFLALKGSADMVGGVAYDNTFTTFALGSITDTDIDGIATGGSTAIGGAISQSMNMLYGAGGAGCPYETTPVAAAPANRFVVLLTDGVENVDPYVSAAHADHLADGCLAQASIYTIGFGKGGADYDPTLLMNIPQRSALGMSANGFHPVEGDITVAGSVDEHALKSAYFKIYADAVDIETVLDPTYVVNLFQPAPQVVGTATITSSDVSAIFAVFDNTDLRTLYNLKLITPKGITAINGALPGGLVSEVSSGDGFTFYKIDFSAAADKAYFSGTWKLILESNAKASADDRNIPKQAAIGFAVATKSNLKMSTGVLAANDQVGSEMLIASELHESGLPLVSANNTFVTVTTPSGNQYKLSSVWEGKRLVSRFPYTFESGIYKVFTRVTVPNLKGELAVREASHYIVLDNKLKAGPIETCLTCYHAKLIIGVIVVLLIVIIVIIIRKKRA